MHAIMKIWEIGTDSVLSEMFSVYVWYSTLEVLTTMHYISRRFTYLLIYMRESSDSITSM